MTEQKDDKYVRSNINAFKAKNGKSITIPLDDETYMAESTNGKLILNVSIKGLLSFLQDPAWTKFGLNKIKEEK